MEFKNMLFKLFVKKLTREADSRDEQNFENQIAKNPRILEEYQLIQQIWNKAENTGIFERIDAESDWRQVHTRIGLSVPTRYRRISWQGYFLRIAALVLLTFGLSFGFYRIITSFHKAETGFVTMTADNHFRDIVLPDGSSVTLNSGSKLTYRNDFGANTREVILEGEALFSVAPDASNPFKVFINESVVEVTGTKFSVREEDGTVKVSVLSGTVILSSMDVVDKKISITANQSGYLLTNSNELGIEKGIPVNNLSWKTGLLVFDETPIDSALIDIAHHFRKELSFETTITEEITAEFQDQPLHEILKELELVAGLQFDTTRTTLIVRK
jgi:ferric-dicitrate binding protein FerR (iron transport regulator)